MIQKSCNWCVLLMLDGQSEGEAGWWCALQGMVCLRCDIPIVIVMYLFPSACCWPRLCRRVHSFGSIDSQGAAVLCIEPAPALDVAAVGLSDGRVQVQNMLVHACVEFTVVC